MTATITAQWVPSARRIEPIFTKPYWHCYRTRGTASRRTCAADHRTETAALACATKRVGILNRRIEHATVKSALVVRKPADRHEALRDLEHAFALAMHTMGCDDDEALREATVRQLRCDLHTLGVTSAELDVAGIKA